MKHAAVIDTNIWISGFFWGGTPLHVLDLVYAGLLTPYFSLATFAEWEEKLSEGASRLRVGERYITFRRDIKRVSLFVEITEHVTVCRDPKDNQFLEAALASAAPFLITGDKDLLSLKSFRTTRIFTPRQFLDEEI